MRRTPEVQPRLVQAFLASAATGVAIYLLVMHVLLPRLEEQLTRSQVEWIWQAFLHHPIVGMAAIFLASAVLALPMLGVFRWVSGPWRGR